MKNNTHQQMANFIWDICNLLRGPYKRNEYRKVILPLTVLRRFDCILASTKDEVLKSYDGIKTKPKTYIDATLCKITGVPFYNISKLNMHKLLDDPNNIAQNLMSYINGYSSNVSEIIERFKFDEQILKMNEKNLIYKVIKKFAEEVDLSPNKLDNIGMGYVFEELIRIGSEQANDQAGEHFTPREVIELIVDILLAPESELNFRDKIVKIYDPTCGTGGMLSVANDHIKELDSTAETHLFGQDYNDEAWALCRADTIIKGKAAENIKLGNTFTEDGFKEETFDYMLANPPFGVSWKQEENFINNEHEKKGFNGRFGAGTPRVNDGSLLFLQHMISKMTPFDPERKQDGSRIGIVFNGSPLFTGDAGSGESDIRRWIIEELDYLEAVIALPDQLFYNTGIYTYIWVLSNKKTPDRKGKVQLIDAREFYKKGASVEQMSKSLGNKRKFIPNGENNTHNYIDAITKLYSTFADDAELTIENDNKTTTAIVSKVLDCRDFGYSKITVERPLRLNFCVNEERIALLKEHTGFKSLSISKKKKAEDILKDEEAGKLRQEALLAFFEDFKIKTGQQIYKDRKAFLENLRRADKTSGIKLTAPELKTVIDAFSEKDETAEICRNSKGEAEPDTDLRDTENVPLKEDIDEYFRREVLPHVPDAWIDYSKTKVGYEIPLTREFYIYTPPRALDVINGEIAALETELFALLRGEV